MEKKLTNLFLGLFVGIVVGVILGFFIFGSGSKHQEFRQENFGNNNFNIDENEIINFFDSSPSDTEIESYCQENPVSCMYYCREIKPELEICGSIEMPPGVNSK